MMTSSRVALPIVLVALLAASLAGCASSGRAFNPPGGGITTFHHMYLSNDNTPGDIFVYTLPVTSASTPAFTLTGIGNNPSELFVDATGRLFVPLEGTSSVVVYSLPLTAASTPAFTLTTAHSNPEDVTEDASGNVYVGEIASSSGYIDAYTGPVTSSRSASYTISNNAIGSTGLEYPYGIAIAPNGDLYASDTADVNQFTPPFSATTVPSASVGGNTNNYGLRVDSSNRVFVANYTADGDVSAFAQPFTNASTPAFTISVAPAKSLFGIGFDGSGNLWALDNSTNLWEVKAPISSTSTATEVLTTTGGFGVVFGP